MTNRTPLEARLWLRVDRREPENCWLWEGQINREGYGLLDRGGDHGVAGAHVVAWEVTHGSRLPKGMTLRHSCDHSTCCNPAHLTVAP